MYSGMFWDFFFSATAFISIGFSCRKENKKGWFLTIKEKVRTFKKRMVMKIEEVQIENIQGSQFIKIPDNLKIDDNKVFLKKVGNSIFIIPFHNPWQNLIQSLDLFSEDFLENRNQLDQEIRESL
jgi:antitoxin VapB